MTVDLFPSRLNSHLPKFYSWRPDPQALATDAFLQDWSLHLNYAFPPFMMIARVLAQVHRQRASLVLVTPFWQTQPWFPSVLELPINFLLLIPTFPELLLDLEGRPHNMILDHTLSLVAWKISGQPGEPPEFRKKLPCISATL
ncbi:hypothetical protein NDU88_002693, partial [Pleurodeles waltl]